MTFIRMAGIALAFLLLGGVAHASTCGPATHIDSAERAIKERAEARGLRYRTLTKDWANTGGHIMYVIVEGGFTVVGYFDDRGCLLHYTTQYPAGTVAQQFFGKTMDELFPPEQSDG